MFRKITALIVALVLAASLAACSSSPSASANEAQNDTAPARETETVPATNETQETDEDSTAETPTSSEQTVYTEIEYVQGGVFNAEEVFTDRDLRQSVDLNGAEHIELKNGETVEITVEGVYVLSGTVQNVTVVVEAPDDAKVQLVLDGVSVTNEDFPCIYVKSADKVFVTTTDSENTLSVTGTFTTDGTTNTDAVIFSRDDIVLNGLGSLKILSTDNGVSCKDDLKVTGGTVSISCVSDGLEANDSVAVAGGNITIVSEKDGIHSENDEDETQGSVLICGGTLDIEAGDDGIHGETVVQIDGGDITISAREGIEGTYVQINGGNIRIYAVDDGINAANKSGAYRATAEFNGGYVAIDMGAGDTDAVDSNGDLFINGGTLDITANSPFDYDGTGQYSGGTIIVNGVETNSLTNQMMGGMGGPGGMQGGMGSPRGFGG